MNSGASVPGGRFRKLASELIHEWYVFRLVKSTFAAPDGTEFVREVVEHPGAVAVVPLHADGTVVCVRQYRAPLDRVILEIPAGLLDKAGEDPQQAAARELREEVGLEAATWELLGSFCAAPGLTDEQYTIYVATDLTDVGTDLDGLEEQYMTVERVRLSDVGTMIAAGDIVDAKTAIGLLIVAGR
jgi:8-oxo-dGTP pyrophosphatase MutT (NUDIX family)